MIFVVLDERFALPFVWHRWCESNHRVDVRDILKLLTVQQTGEATIHASVHTLATYLTDLVACTAIALTAQRDKYKLARVIVECIVKNSSVDVLEHLHIACAFIAQPFPVIEDFRGHLIPILVEAVQLRRLKDVAGMRCKGALLVLGGAFLHLGSALDRPKEQAKMKDEDV